MHALECLIKFLTRKSFLSWVAARDDTASIHSIADAKKYFSDLQLDHALSDLEEKNYGSQTSPWIGAELSSIVKRLRKDAKVRKGENVDLLTITPKILSKKIKRKPKLIPNAKLTPIPPLRLKDETATAINVKINDEIGILHLLCLTNK